MALALVACSCLMPAGASAHRFGGPNDPCERKIGSALIHITLYQPQFDPDGEYCEQVPRAGNTVLVVDTLGEELRDVPIALDVVAAGGSEPPRSVLSVPPQVYRRGVADVQVMLTPGHRYVVRVSLSRGGAPAQVLSFPIRVGSWYRALIVPALMVLAVITLTAVSVIRYYWSSAKPRPVRSLGRSRICLLASAALICGVALGGCAPRPQPGNAALPDVSVVDDHGRPLALGALRGKVVLLQFIHIGCPGVCDTLVSKFGQIADGLGPDLGARVVLLSVTNDPEHDTPARLLALARSREADVAGWLFVTGSAGEIDRVIKAFGLHNERLPDGSPNHITQVFLLGPDLRARHQYAGMTLDLHSVRIAIKEALAGGGKKKAGGVTARFAVPHPG